MRSGRPATQSIMFPLICPSIVTSTCTPCVPSNESCQQATMNYMKDEDTMRWRNEQCFRTTPNVDRVVRWQCHDDSESSYVVYHCPHKWLSQRRAWQRDKWRQWGPEREEQHAPRCASCCTKPAWRASSVECLILYMWPRASRSASSICC